MKQKTKDMRIQNFGHAASGMRLAEIIPTSARRGRLFLTLLMMLLTATTARAWSGSGTAADPFLYIEGATIKYFCTRKY